MKILYHAIYQKYSENMEDAKSATFYAENNSEAIKKGWIKCPESWYMYLFRIGKEIDINNLS